MAQDPNSNSHATPSITADTDDGWQVESASEARAGQTIEQIQAELAEPAAADDQPARAQATPTTPEPPTAPVPADKPPVAAKKTAEQDLEGRIASLKQRTQQATYELREAERRREQIRQENDQWERDLATRRQTPAPGPAPAVDEDDAMPMWGGTGGYQEQGKEWDEFEKDQKAWFRAQLTKTRTEAEHVIARERQTLEQRVTEERNRARDEAIRGHDTERLTAAHAKHPDFEELASNLDDIDASPGMMGLFMLHPQGPELLYHLAQHPDEARVLAAPGGLSEPILELARSSEDPIPLLSHLATHEADLRKIAGLPPAHAYVALARLLARLDGAPGSPSRAPVSQAAPPIRPVGGGSRSAGALSSPEDDDEEFSPEWVARRNREEADKGAGRRL